MPRMGHKPAMYRQKPGVVEALQFDGHNHREVQSFTNNNAKLAKLGEGQSLILSSGKGAWVVREGEWIFKNARGEFHTCDNEFFEATFDLIGD